MTPISIGTAQSLYETASKCGITRHSVDHAGLAEVSHSLRELTRSLDAEAEEDFWLGLLGPLRRVAFAFCSTPLPFDKAAAAARVDWELLDHQVRVCEDLYPDSHADLANLVHHIQQLSSERSTPFAAPLAELARDASEISVLLRNRRMNQAVAEHFATRAELSAVTVVGERQLRDGCHRGALVAIGPCGWFPDYVFSAPRATDIHVVSFRWIQDTWKPEPVFLSGSGGDADETRRHIVGVLPKMATQVAKHGGSQSHIRPVELLPDLLSFAAAESRIASWETSADEETTAAKLCHLTGGRTVLLSCEPGSSSLVIDTAELGRSVVRRVSTGDLEPGLFLLLRTSGGGDYIAPLADRILGARAAERRSQQAMWKDQVLTAAQEKFGSHSRREYATHISETLRSQNISDARPTNIHYWLSSKCIHPRNREAFAALLAFAGMSDKVQKYWQAMVEIERAHKRAGQAIRKMLLRRITTSSLAPLERDGEMEFDLGDNDGGTLAAFQITGVSEDEYEVAIDRIGVLMDSED